MDLTDPAFPHGTNRGYQRGCRKPNAATCPGDVSCNDAHNTRKRAEHHARDEATVGQAKTSHVMRRLQQCIDTVGIDAVAAHTGLTVGTIRRRQTITTTTMSYEKAAPLDRAWAWFVHGVDVTAPGFPHGDQRGYTAYCRCERCGDASTRTAKRRAAGIITSTSKIMDEASLARLSRHTATLIAVGNAHAVARAAGLSFDAIGSALRAEVVIASTANAIMRLTPADVEAALKPNGLVPAAEAIHTLRTLWAQGYPLTWLGEQIGASKRDISRLGANGYITRRRQEQVRQLAARIGDRFATPDQGIAPGSITRALSQSRAAGWYPRACYDEDGTLNPRTVPDHPWAALDDRCAIAVTGCYLVGQGMTIAAAADRVGASRKMLERDGSMFHGYVYEAGSAYNAWASRARFVEVSRIFHEWQDGAIGPVTAALMLGFAVYNPDPIKRQHPELVAWREQHTDEEQDTAA